VVTMVTPVTKVPRQFRRALWSIGDTAPAQWLIRRGNYSWNI
jgi:hypothetical protein